MNIRQYHDGSLIAYLPSDYFNGIRSVVDPTACYKDKDFLPPTEGGVISAPSPYLGDDNTLNPEYIANIGVFFGNELNNPFRDLDGLSNTRTLIGLGEEYEAAFEPNRIFTEWIKSDIDYLNEDGLINYNSDLLNVETYLPSIGELGFIVPRFKRIKQSMEIIDKEMYNNWGWGTDNYIFLTDYYDEYENQVLYYIWSSTEADSRNGYCVTLKRLSDDYSYGFSCQPIYKEREQYDDIPRHILPFAILE
jgi:hypothetical protein